MRTRWQILVPIKPLGRAKTRIEASPGVRESLALAMCKDVVVAALQSPNVERVCVLTSDRTVSHEVRSLGAEAWKTPGAPGLNEELSRALNAVPEGWGAAAIMADLACLTASLLTAVTDSAPAASPSFVPDRAERGTTMLLMPPARRVSPRFGVGSALAHAGLATRLPGDGSWFGARHDIDTIPDLRQAARHGLGSFTGAVAAALRQCDPGRTPAHLAHDALLGRVGSTAHHG